MEGWMDGLDRWLEPYPRRSVTLLWSLYASIHFLPGLNQLTNQSIKAVSDWSERVSPDHGRVAVAQFTVFIGIPFWLLILFGLPESPSDENAVVYAGVGFLTAALISWAYSTKSTIMSEIVRPEVRSTVYALDRVGEGTISAA